MSFGNVCKHCGHYEGDHDKDGKCHFQHRSVNAGKPCECNRYELREELSLADYFKQKKKK